jgi:hypothetical protein
MCRDRVRSISRMTTSWSHFRTRTTSWCATSHGA